MAAVDEHYVHCFTAVRFVYDLEEHIPLAGCRIHRRRPETMGRILREGQNTRSLIIGKQHFLHIVGRCCKVRYGIIPNNAGSKITMTYKACIIAIARPPHPLGILFASQHKCSVSKCVSKIADHISAVSMDGGSILRHAYFLPGRIDAVVLVVQNRKILQIKMFIDKINRIAKRCVKTTC